MSAAESESRFEAFWPDGAGFPPLAPWLATTLPRSTARLAFVADDALTTCPCGPAYGSQLLRFIEAMRDRPAQSTGEAGLVKAEGKAAAPVRTDPERAACGCAAAPDVPGTVPATSTPCGGAGDHGASQQAQGPAADHACPPSPAQGPPALPPRPTQVAGPTALIGALSRWAHVDRAVAEQAIGRLVRVSGPRALSELAAASEGRLESMLAAPRGGPSPGVLWSPPTWAPPLAARTANDFVVDTGTRIYAILPLIGPDDDPGANGIDWVLAPYVRDKARWANFATQIQPLFDTRHLTWPSVAAADIRYPRWRTGTPFLQRFVEHALNAVYAYRGDLDDHWPVGAGAGVADKQFCADMADALERRFDEPSRLLRVYDEASSGGCDGAATFDTDTSRAAFIFHELAADPTVWKSIRVDFRTEDGPVACHQPQVWPWPDYLTIARRPMLSLAYAFDECVWLGNLCYQVAFDPIGRGAVKIDTFERLYLLGMAQRFGSGALGALAEASHALMHEFIHLECKVNHCKASCAPNGLAARWFGRRMAGWGGVWCPVNAPRLGELGDLNAVASAGAATESGLVDLDARFGNTRRLTSGCGDTRKDASQYVLGVSIAPYSKPGADASFCCESFASGNNCLQSPGSLVLLDACNDISGSDDSPCSS